MENAVTLYLKYRDDFNNKSIIDTWNSSGPGGHPGINCSSINYDNFTTACQKFGRYLIEINNRYKSNSLKSCKYLNYRINSDKNYNKNPDCFQKNTSTSCENSKNCYEYYIEHYKEYEENIFNEFCEALINFKKVYVDTVSDITICSHVPKILAPPKSLFFLPFTPVKSWLHSRLQRKKIIQLNDVRDETRESLKNAP
ncbi:PIR Superfamily Protein [Plasmodium malariae]|uniref:PIR Superfamily Protein n=1 Tax=Plasmodium malariae TaxID=5858 RepID=A0A1A8WKC0_PLAMA|nr:PIR Superfamily Protein [Plasmodium malariae]